MHGYGPNVVWRRKLFPLFGSEWPKLLSSQLSDGARTRLLLGVSNFHETIASSDERWKIARCCGAKHISKSKCTKHIMFGPLLEVEMSKKCTPLWHEAHFEVKTYRKHHVRTLFGSWDVEKVHAVVARSTFRSQYVQTTPCSNPFWKLRCRKSARRCGAKHISKSKRSKHQGFRPLLDVQMSFRVAGARDCAPCQKWAKPKHEGFVAFSTTTTTAPHDTPIHYTTTTTTTTPSLHSITLHSTTLHYTTLNCTQFHYTTLHYTKVHYTTLHYTTLHYIQLHSTTLHSITLHCTALHYTTLHSTTLDYTTLTTTTTTTATTILHLHYATLHYTTLHITTLPYPTLHYIALHCITLHSLHHHKCNCNCTTLITLHHNYNSTTLQLQLQLHYTTLHPAVVGEVTDQVATATIAAIQKAQLQPPFGPSVDLLCHPWFTTTNLSYRFHIFETSATALRGTTGTPINTIWLGSLVESPIKYIPMISHLSGQKYSNSLTRNAGLLRCFPVQKIRPKIWPKQLWKRVSLTKLGMPQQHNFSMWNMMINNVVFSMNQGYFQIWCRYNHSFPICSHSFPWLYPCIWNFTHFLGIHHLLITIWIIGIIPFIYDT